jgi:tetratricopeptide (TPR) repeat protein
MWTRIAGTLASLICLIAPGQSARAEEAAVDAPWSAPHLQGMDAYQAGDHARAVEAFEQADRLGAPASNLYNLARSYEQLGRVVDALRAYDRYLESPDIPADRRARATELRDQLAATPGRVVVRSTPEGASLEVDGQPDPEGAATPATLSLAPGPHTIAARLDGRRPASGEVVVEPGGEHEVSLVLDAAAETAPVSGPIEPAVVPAEPRDEGGSGRRSSAGAWVLFGGGLLVAAVGCVLDVVAYTRAEDAQGFDDIEEYDAWYDLVGNAALAGDVLVGVGAAAFVAGLVWLLVDRRGDRGRADVRAGRPWGVAPTGTGLTLQLGF